MEPAVWGFIGVIVGAVLTSWLGHRNELARAREERRQERLAKTYLEVIEMVVTASDWVERTHPQMTQVGQPGPPEIPTDERQRLLRAGLSAYGSPAMQKALWEVSCAFWAFANAADYYQSLEDRAKRSPAAAEELPKARRAMYDIREKQVRPAENALLELANAELAERRLGRWARLRTGVGGVLHHAGKPS